MENSSISEEDMQEFEAKFSRGEKRMKDLYKIVERITDEYESEYVGTNHIILHDKNTGERFDLKGKLAILKWCVNYVDDNLNENNVPLSELYYLPIVLIRKASDEAMVRDFKAAGHEINKKAVRDIVIAEHIGITTKCALTKSFRADGKLVYFDAYELALVDRLDEYLADIADKHLSGKISDDEFENLVQAHDMDKLIEQDSKHAGK